MTHHLVIRILTKLLIPPILLFAFYVQFHGDYGPGGGFQAGVIFASAFILHGLVFGIHETQKVLPLWLLQVLAACGLLLYAGVGLLAWGLGGEYLNYSVLLNNPVRGQHFGIFLVELGVGVCVQAVMLIIYYSFADLTNKDNP